MSVTAVRSALPEQPATREHAKSAIDEITQRQIAALLYKRDSRNPRAILEDLDPVSRGKYLDVAMMALRQVNDEFHVPALYAAVDAGDRFEGGSGVATMVRDVRIHELERFEKSLRAYRRFLSSADPDTMARFRAFVDADRHH